MSEGAAKSRAALVSKAVRRLEREDRAARDLQDIISRGRNAYPDLGLDHDSVINCDAIQTVPAVNLLRQVGYLLPEQEDALSDAIHAAFDLD